MNRTARPDAAHPIEWADLEWAQHAACNGMGVGWFEPIGKGPDQHPDPHAAATCAGCPVRANCLHWALKIDDRWLVLGGTTPNQRARMRRRRKVRRYAGQDA